MTSAAAPKAYPFNAINRGVYIADNLDFLRTINDECVDLVCIDPPFAKNETFTAEKLKPPLSQQETENEKRLLAEWGIRSAQDAAQVEIAWPYGGRTRGGYKDIWSWEKDVHYDWIESIDDHFPAVNKLIDATRYVHSESTAAYLCYMAIRLIENLPGAEAYRQPLSALRSYRQRIFAAIDGRDLWPWRKRRAGFPQRNRLVLHRPQQYAEVVSPQTRHYILVFQIRTMDFQSRCGTYPLQTIEYPTRQRFRQNHWNRRAIKRG